jgi:hypothetical protein
LTNSAFYAFCRDQRKVEPDAHKKAALKDAYSYMRECGVTKKGVTDYLTHRIGELTREHQRPLIGAYRWVLEVFAGNRSVQETEGMGAGASIWS